jgi:hypothetical protein
MLRGLGAITAGAAAAVAAVPAISHCRDARPLGLVEAHKAAWARLLETEDRNQRLRGAREGGKRSGHRARCDHGNPAESVAGARASIEYLVEWEQGGPAGITTACGHCCARRLWSAQGSLMTANGLLLAAIAALAVAAKPDPILGLNIYVR